MKKTILICYLFSLFLPTLIFSQKIDLSEEKSVKSYLNGKKFTVGDYGTVEFEYDTYDKEFGRIKFDVEYKISGEKKPKKIKLKAEIFIKYNDFNMPKFVRPFSLSYPESPYVESFSFPTNFELYENGELYYQERTSITMEDYLKSRTSGKIQPTDKGLIAPFKLCK